ncbi:MAG: hypothetical protein K2J95_07415 [Lachnospiraceae bacterium]|nr:hypothetical protein [Lachnospiraceae bacterium]
MKKRDWPEEMDWIRKQDQMLYKLINILSVAAMLLLVCVVVHRATVYGAESAMAAGMAQMSEDFPMEVIRLTVFDDQMAEAVASAQDALLQASLEPGVAVLDVFGQNEQQSEMEENECDDSVIAQTDYDQYVNEDGNMENEDGNMENGIVGRIYDGTPVEIWDAVEVAVECTAYYDVAKDDRQNERGQPGILTDLEPPDMACTSNGEFRKSMANYAMRSNCIRALS